MWWPSHTSACSRCALVLAAAALLPCSLAREGQEWEEAGEAGPLEAALDSGDECVPAAAPGAASPPSCSLNALQMRRARGSRSAADAAEEGGSGRSGSGAFESSPAVQGSWASEGRCSSDVPHELLFIMKYADADKVEREARDRTDPRSPNFRKWLSKDEVAALTRNEAGLKRVKAYLGSEGPMAVVQETAGGEIVRAEATVGVWERILQAEFSVHRHHDTGRVLVRAPSYSLPKELHEHVSGVLKVVELGEVLTAAPHRSVPAGALPQQANATSNDTGLDTNCTMEAIAPVCESFEELKAVSPVAISPPLLRKIYNVPPVALDHSEEAYARRKTSQMVYASLNQHWSPSDRREFVSAFGIPPENKVVQLDLGDAMSSDEVCRESPGECAESNLDVQYMTAMSPWSKMGYYYMPADTTFYEFLYRFIVDVSEMLESPHVISISYGMPEAGATKSAQHAFDMMAKSLALQGVTLLAASGDDGAASSLDRSMHFGPCGIVERVGLQASWPATSPWVTGVGATMGAGAGLPEVVCQINATGPAAEAAGRSQPLITSGGGFSTRFRRPEWQNGHHGKQTRGVPDVSLAGHAYAVVLGGKWLMVDGTSASSPAFAGMISLINADRLTHGLPRVGFLNPLLYKHPEVFRDVTEGDNRCGAHGVPCCGGYDAGEGWDPVTGLGSVDFAKLVAALGKDSN